MTTEEKIRAFFGSVLYLRGLYKEEMYEIVEIEKTKYRALREAAETKKLFWAIEEIVQNYTKITCIQLGLISSKKSVREVYTLNNQNNMFREFGYIETDVLKELCKILQALRSDRMDTRKTRVKIKISSTQGPGRSSSDDDCFVSSTELFSTNEPSNYVTCIKNVQIDICNPIGSTEEKKVDESRNSIRCVCTIDIDDGDMIECSRCFKWLHTVCCGFYSNRDRRTFISPFVCLCCNNGHFLQARELALERKVLSIIFNEVPMDNIELVVRRTGLSKTKIGSILRKFKLLRLINYLNIKKGNFVINRTNETKKMIRKYFDNSTFIKETN